MSKYILLRRTRFEKVQTTGILWVLNGRQTLYSSFTLELPWINNERYVSCIPLGSYDVTKRHSARFGDHFHVLGVPGRRLILIHHGNFYHDTKGCILPGKTLADIDNDGYRDVTHSKQTMIELNSLLPERFNLTVL